MEHQDRDTQQAHAELKQNATYDDPLLYLGVKRRRGGNTSARQLKQDAMIRLLLGRGWNGGVAFCCRPSLSCLFFCLAFDFAFAFSSFFFFFPQEGSGGINRK